MNNLRHLLVAVVSLAGLGIAFGSSLEPRGESVATSNGGGTIPGTCIGAEGFGSPFLCFIDTFVVHNRGASCVADSAQTPCSGLLPRFSTGTLQSPPRPFRFDFKATISNSNKPTVFALIMCDALLPNSCTRVATYTLNGSGTLEGSTPAITPNSQNGLSFNLQLDSLPAGATLNFDRLALNFFVAGQSLAPVTVCKNQGAGFNDNTLARFEIEEYWQNAPVATRTLQLPGKHTCSDPFNVRTGTLLVVRELTSKDETVGFMTASPASLSDLPDYVNYLYAARIDAPRTVYFSKKKFGNQGCSAAYYLAHPQQLPPASTAPMYLFFSQQGPLFNYLNPQYDPSQPDPALALAGTLAFANAAQPDVAYPYRFVDILNWMTVSYAGSDSPALVAKLNAANAGKGGCPLP